MTPTLIAMLEQRLTGLAGDVAASCKAALSQHSVRISGPSPVEVGELLRIYETRAGTLEGERRSELAAVLERFRGSPHGSILQLVTVRNPDEGWLVVLPVDAEASVVRVPRQMALARPIDRARNSGVKE